MKKFKYVGVPFTSDGKQDQEFNVPSGKTSAVTRAFYNLKSWLVVQNFRIAWSRMFISFEAFRLTLTTKDRQNREHRNLVVLNRELSRMAKLSVFKLIFVRILTYGHEYRVITEKVRSQIQASEMRFL